MDFPHFVGTTGVVQNTFAHRCFTGVDVRGNTDVSYIFKFMRSWHLFKPSLNFTESESGNRKKERLRTPLPVSHCLIASVNARTHGEMP
jgi:hypothetical protein